MPFAPDLPTVFQLLNPHTITLYIRVAGISLDLRTVFQPLSPYTITRCYIRVDARLLKHQKSIDNCNIVRYGAPNKIKKGC